MPQQCWPDNEVHGGSGLRVARKESGVQRFSFLRKPEAHGRSLDYHEPTDAEALHDVWFEARKTVLLPARLHVRLEKWGRDGRYYTYIVKICRALFQRQPKTNVWWIRIYKRPLKATD